MNIKRCVNCGRFVTKQTDDYNYCSLNCEEEFDTKLLFGFLNKVFSIHNNNSEFMKLIEQDDKWHDKIVEMDIVAKRKAKTYILTRRYERTDGI